MHFIPFFEYRLYAVLSHPPLKSAIFHQVKNALCEDMENSDCFYGADRNILLIRLYHDNNISTEQLSKHHILKTYYFPLTLYLSDIYFTDSMIDTLPFDKRSKL